MNGETVDALAAGERALSIGAWEEARTAFETALAEEEWAAAFDGLGRALWWLSDDAGEAS